MASRIKRCPFCGGQVKRHNLLFQGTEFECTNPKCQASTIFYAEDEGLDATKLWNQRKEKK
jgi:hypothetical protein